jgi:hypothetical protein
MMPGWGNGSPPPLLGGSAGSSPDPGSRFVSKSGSLPLICLFVKKERERPTATLPAALQAALDGFLLLFNALLAVVIGILFPATPTALSLIADFGLMAALLVGTIMLVKKFTNW